MTESVTSAGRTLRVRNLSRVEGEGGIVLQLRDGAVEDVKVDIFEPPRFFEAFLRGRHLTEVPDLTARICGICPVAYQVTSAAAIESALGVTIPPELRMLRRLIYLAEWIESHALHIYLLNAPDFLGYESAIALAADHPALVEKALRLKKVGNDLLDFLGGRSSHPVSVAIGGFHHVPRRDDLLARRDAVQWALETSKETVAVVSKFAFPKLECDYEFVAMSHPGEYAIDEGRIVSSRGLDIAVADYETHFKELHFEHSTALHSVRTDSMKSYFVGPLARLNLHPGTLLPAASAAARGCGIDWPSDNPFHGIVARAIELVHACEESLQIIDAYREPAASRVPYQIRAGEGCAATEAPRGILYHRYTVGSNGLIETAKIVPPTAQNLHRMEDDLRAYAPTLLNLPDAEIARACENLIRTYDPCISCSTHALKLRIERNRVSSS